jgi:CRP/FNR family cyclic AMP-dependent transcriptional regulator
MKLPNIFESDTPPLNFSAGDIIFSTGDSGTDMFVVKSGEVELRVGGKAVEVVKEEGFFGEMALIEEGPRTATAVAKTDCVLVPINEQRFEFMVHEVPLFALFVMKGLSKRLRNVDAASL